MGSKKSNNIVLEAVISDNSGYDLRVNDDAGVALSPSPADGL